MSGFPLTLKDFALYLDAFPTRHNVSEVTLPKISYKTQSLQMGTFTSETRMGLDVLTVEMTFYELTKTIIAE